MRVFAVEGEGGHTAGAHHEVKNSAWGLGLGNLVYLMDWNDHGIDVHKCSDVVHGTPEDWFKPYGWRVAGTEDGSRFAALLPALHELLAGRHGQERRVVQQAERARFGRRERRQIARDGAELVHFRRRACRWRTRGRAGSWRDDRARR